MNEKQLQFSIVRKFSEEYPEKNGQLFSVRNTTLSVKDGATQKALGMKAGVSDLIYIDSGVIVAIEIKAPGKPHNRNHILKQYVWGETITREGGEYYIVTSVEDFMSIIEGGELLEGVYTLEKIQKKLDTGRSEIRF